MYHRVVLTAGTSAFAPANLGAWAKGQAIFHWPARDPQIPVGHTHADTFDAWTKAVATLRDFDPKRTSAEISALNALRTRARLADKPHVVVIFTETIAGRAAALVVQRAAEIMFGAYVQLKPVEGLDANAPPAMRAALGRFMSTVAEALEAGEPRGTCFAPLGGYKVMTSLGYLAGAYLGFPTAYLHEDQQVLHTIPAVPIRIDAQEMKTVGPLFRRVGEAADYAALSTRDHEQIEAHPYLFERDDDLIGVSAFGQFLKTRPALRPHLGTQIHASTQVIDTIPVGELAWITGQLDTLMRIKDKPSRRGEVFHEKNYKLGKTPFHLYKGASNGRVVFRAAWRYDEASDTIEFNHLWLDHDLCVREAKQGLGLQHAAPNFRDITADLFAPRPENAP